MPFLSKFRIRISHRVAVEAVHDLSLFIGAFVATGVLDHANVSKQTAVAAAITALRVTLRGILPAPVETIVEHTVLGSLPERVAAAIAAHTRNAKAASVAVPSPAVAPAPVAADVPPPSAPASPVA